MADIWLFLELPSEVVPVLLFLTREKIASFATRMLKRGVVPPWQGWSWDYMMRDWRICRLSCMVMLLIIAGQPMDYREMARRL